MRGRRNRRDRRITERRRIETLGPSDVRVRVRTDTPPSSRLLTPTRVRPSTLVEAERLIRAEPDMSFEAPIWWVLEPACD